MKYTRGVQQEEVSEAADGLLAGGIRPTIERIRQRLGRGSPNTVAPMLEIWFSGLGKRLGVAGDGGSEGPMPAAASQAFAKLWDAAMLIAGKEAEAALIRDRQALSDQQTALSAREASLVQQEQALEQRQVVVDALLQSEKDKAANIEERLTSAQEQLRARDGSVSELRRELANVQELLQTARCNIDDLARRHTEERAKWEERSAGNERRLLGEIDRERIASNQAQTEAEEARAQLEITRTNLEKRVMVLGQKLHNSELELGISRHAVQVGDQRCEELSAQMREQRDNTSKLQEQLKQAIAAMSQNRTPAKRKAVAPAGKVL